MRVLIDLPDEELKRLADICRRQNISRAEAVRQAVAGYTRAAAPAIRSQALQSAFGLWKGRDIDGLTYQETLRSEWERDDA